MDSDTRAARVRSASPGRQAGDALSSFLGVVEEANIQAAAITVAVTTMTASVAALTAVSDRVAKIEGETAVTAEQM